MLLKIFLKQQYFPILFFSFEKIRFIEQLIVQTLLNFLQLPLVFNKNLILQLIRSPYLNGAVKEQDQRIQLSYILNTQAAHYLSFAHLIQQCQAYQCPRLLKIFQQCFTLYQNTHLQTFHQ